MEDDAEGEAFAGVEAADAVAHVDAVPAAAASRLRRRGCLGCSFMLVSFWLGAWWRSMGLMDVKLAR